MLTPSLLDLDLYKPTVHQIIFHRFNNVSGEYMFTCRNNGKVKLTDYIPLEELRAELQALETLSLSTFEYSYLQSKDWITPEYLEYLKGFRLRFDYLDVTLADGEFKIFARGPLLNIQMFETHVLAVVNGLYTRNFCTKHGIDVSTWAKAGHERLSNKIDILKEYNSTLPKDQRPALIEFGTRRRASFHWQEQVLLTLRHELPDNLVGTSNLHLAHKHNLTPIGTFGHEFLMAMQGLHPIQHSQREAFKIWLREYRGMWGIALTDTLGDAKFLKDFSFELAKGYDGVRHDSGDPLTYGDMIINMYKKFGIDPMSKRIVFSDGLDFESMIQIHKHFLGKIKMSFGIGTNLTNDMGLWNVPQNVMKLTRCHNQPVCKLSNNAGKISCIDPIFAQYARHAVDNYL